MSDNSLSVIATLCAKIDSTLELTPDRALDLFYDDDQLDRQVDNLLERRQELGICSLLNSICKNPDKEQRVKVWCSALREAIRTQCSLFIKEAGLVPQPRKALTMSELVSA